MDKPALRVVIADDEPITRMDIKEILEEKGYEVIGEAADGFDAVELCKAKSRSSCSWTSRCPCSTGFLRRAL